MKPIIPALGLTALLLSTTALHAQNSQALNLAEQLVADGFRDVEVTIGATRTTVEGIRDGIEREVVFDSQSGALLASETGPADADDIAGAALDDGGIDISREDDDDRDDDDDPDDGPDGDGPADDDAADDDDRDDDGRDDDDRDDDDRDDDDRDDDDDDDDDDRSGNDRDDD